MSFLFSKWVEVFRCTTECMVNRSIYLDHQTTTVILTKKMHATTHRLYSYLIIKKTKLPVEFAYLSPEISFKVKINKHCQHWTGTVVDCYFEIVHQKKECLIKLKLISMKPFKWPTIISFFQSFKLSIFRCYRC